MKLVTIYFSVCYTLLLLNNYEYLDIIKIGEKL